MENGLEALMSPNDPSGYTSVHPTALNAFCVPGAG